MMRTAIIIERTSLRLGGAEKSIAELAQELTRRGIDVRILAASGQAGPNTTVLCSGGNKRTGLNTFAGAIKAYIRDNRFDIIHSTLPFDFADIYQPRGGSFKEAMLANTASYGNFVVRTFKRITHFANLRRTACIRAEKRICRPDGRPVVAALSEYVKGQFIRHYNLPPQRLAVIPNGVSVDNDIDSEEAQKFRSSILRQINLPEKSKAVLFLFAANNFRIKGLRELLSALSKALKNNPALPAVMIIAGSDNPASYKNLCGKLGLSDRVVFTGPLDSITAALCAADAAVLPTWYDPCSRFILEALALCKPVITTLFNGAAERYVHSRHGYVIENPADTGALSEAVATMCQASIRAQMRSAIGADNIRGAVSIGNHVDKLLELYQNILKGRK